MSRKYAIIGLGSFGISIAKELSLKGEEVLVIDKNEDIIEKIKNEVSYAITLDATDQNALMQQNITDFETVVVSIGDKNIEALLLTTVLLLEMKIPKVIARAVTESQRKVLSRLGVKEIISPEETMGKLLAERLLFPTIKNFIELPDEIIVAEIEAPAGIIGGSVLEIDMEHETNLKIIAITRTYKESNTKTELSLKHLITDIDSETIISDEDVLVILGRKKDIQKFIDLSS